jgi:tetratricopeptide (TPR) repeat protein
VYAVSFSPDGNLLASAGQEEDVRVWDLRHPNASPVVLSGHESYVNSVTFSPDGKSLASASLDNTVRVWDLQNPNVRPRVLYQQAPVNAVAFAPGGNYLASAGQEGLIQVWDLHQPNAAPLVLSGKQGSINSVAFAPDGNYVASAGDDKTVRLWPLWVAAADYLCTVVWRNLSLEEWQFYIGKDIPYERTCPNLPPGRHAPGAEVLPVQPITAERSREWALCAELQISACTTLIESRTETQGDLAILFYNRALGYRSKGNYDRAIQDFDQAIRLKPDDVSAYHGRGVAYLFKNDNERAIQDFDSAIRLKPDDEGAYYITAAGGSTHLKTTRTTRSRTMTRRSAWTPTTQLRTTPAVSPMA